MSCRRPGLEQRVFVCVDGSARDGHWSNADVWVSVEDANRVVWDDPSEAVGLLGSVLCERV